MEIFDVTGTKLTPSFHGEICKGNGTHKGIECCCDECDYYTECFPETYEDKKNTAIAYFSTTTTMNKEELPLKGL